MIENAKSPTKINSSRGISSQKAANLLKPVRNNQQINSARSRNTSQVKGSDYISKTLQLPKQQEIIPKELLTKDGRVKSPAKKAKQ